MTKRERSARILIVDDEPGIRDVLCLHLGDEGHQVAVADSGSVAVEMLTASHFDLVITDLVMRSGDGYAVMAFVERQCPNTAIVVITAYGSFHSAVEALRRGAADYVQKPFELALMSLTVDRVLEKQRLAREVAHRAEQLGVLSEITQAINANLDIQEVYRTLAREAGRVVDLGEMTLSLLTSNGRELTQKSLVGAQPSADEEYVLLSLENSAEGWVIEQRCPLLVPDVAQDASVARWAMRPLAGVRSLIVAPLVVKDKAIGALSCGHAWPNAYDENDLTIVALMAGQLATAIENARLLQQTRQQLETLKRTQTELIRAARLAAVGELARGLAHELNNPLSVILGLTQLWQNPDVPGSLTADLNKIAHNAARMARLVQSFDDLARPASQELHPVDVNEAVQQVLHLLGARFDEQDIAIRTVFSSPSAQVWGCAEQIKQILLNLLVNACEATARVTPPPGGHKIVVETFLSRRGEDGQWVSIVISDTGSGIEPDDLPRIFDPGYTTKVENGTVRGLGMGLYASHGLVRAYGGDIDVESQPGRGSRFTIRLPAETTKESVAETNE